MDEANSSVHCGQIEVSTFDHPRRKLDDLLSRECFLHHETADDCVADSECNGCLLHGDPAALFRWRTGWEALGVANVLHALLRPGVVVAGAIAQPIQDRHDGTIFRSRLTTFRQLGPSRSTSALSIWRAIRGLPTRLKTAKGSSDLVEYGQNCAESDSLQPEAIRRKSEDRSQKFLLSGQTGKLN